MLNDSKSIKTRNPAADLIRCFACYLVITVHFFYNTGFYSTIVTGKRMYLMVMIRTAGMICVPLFLILSGYLSNKKTLSVRYYTKKIKIIVIYVLASITCDIYKISVLQENRTIKECIKGILSFSSAKYSWYVEMYIGLALVIPFFNLLWNSIPNKFWKKMLVVSLIMMSSLPSLINVYNFSYPGWWKQPSLNQEYIKIIPDKWNAIYPFTYYFIGCYFRDCKLSIKKNTSLILICALDIFAGTYNYWRSYRSIFLMGPWSTFSSLFSVVLAVLVFDFFLKLDYRKMPDLLKKFFQWVSGLCLGAYLVSWIFDNMFYKNINETISYSPNKLKYIFIFVPFIYICSIVTSFILNSIYNVLHAGYLWIVQRITRKLKN